MARDDGAVATRWRLRRCDRQFNESLGCSPAAVAATLSALQVRGIPKNNADCVMPRCLRAIAGAEKVVANIKVGVRIVQITRVGGHRPLTVRFPKPVSKFICAFDNGCYPELVDPYDPRRVPTGDSGNKVVP
jgi:hypothetical protein